MRLRRKRELEAEVIEVVEEKEKVEKKTAKIDKLAKELRDHLKENNLGQRLYEQMAQSWR